MERIQIDYLRYNLGLACASPLVAAYLMQRYGSGKSKPGWRERWGRLPDDLCAQLGRRPRLWVHAVSAGEVVAAVPILRELKARLPERALLLSVITPTGHEMAVKQASPFIDGLFYFPFDLPWVARRVARQIRPELFVTLESELWPNLLHELKRQGARTVMANGRISQRSFARVRRFAPGLFRWMLSNVDRFLMQSAADAERIRTLGDLREPGRVAILGNSKFDQEIATLSSDEVLALRSSLHLPSGAPVFVAGSTRSAEEEKIVARAYLAMRAQCSELCLIVAPRHNSRAAETLTLLRQAELNPVLKTELNEHSGEARHLVLDTMGELARLYAAADIVFIGNTFPPVVQGGGQNLLQPLAHGKPVLFGPHTVSIQSEVALALDSGVGFRVADSATLASEGLRLLQDEPLRREIEVHARDLVAANRGVSTRYAQSIAALLDPDEVFRCSGVQAFRKNKSLL